MILHNVVQTIFLLAGIISLFASLFNWEWFFTADNASFLVTRLGRNGARWVYGTIGIVFIAAAIYFYYRIESM
ncbi:MAG: immunity 17 family protein [Bacteroidaceae bacterium]|nr:immunity 17 family protein [Bacteroidaceae bacterium]